MMRLVLKSVADLFFPRRCVVCGRRLSAAEKWFCTPCHFGLPFTQWHGRLGNPVERLFWARIPVERANAYLHYQAGADSSRLVHALKYYGRPGVGRFLGRAMAADLLHADFFNDVDCIVPIPLARQRQRRRGYNQSEQLAKGVAAVVGIPVIKEAVERHVNNPTQTSLTRQQRTENVRGIFRLRRPELLQGKHILLVDDVLTTGATVLSCAEELSRAGNVKFSILTLFVAGHHGMGPLLSEKDA